MRDNLKDSSYFKDFIHFQQERFNRRQEKLDKGLFKVDRIKAIQLDMLKGLLNKMIASYSLGTGYDNLESDLCKIIDLLEKCWVDSRKITTQKEKLNQYGSEAYLEMLRVMSFGCLLDIPKNQFLRIVHIIDADEIRDNLYEYIIKFKIDYREQSVEESYKEFYGVPNTFSLLRKAININQRKISTELIKDFLENEWYQNHRKMEAGWVDSHKSKHNTYYGYWCFEAAAVTCIKGLDDSSYRDHPYYPKDLADYYRANNS
ncbi:MAG: PoNe immunity protein domain-containing protein [Cyclobacteriaceae bacterium]